MLRNIFIPASEFVVDQDTPDRSVVMLPNPFRFEKRRYVGAFALSFHGLDSSPKMHDLLPEGRMSDQNYPGNLHSIYANAALFAVSEDCELEVFEGSGEVQLTLPFVAGKFRGLYLMYKD